MASRFDYVNIAAIISSLRAKHCTLKGNEPTDDMMLDLVRDFSDYFYHNNPHFKRQVFYKACGLDPAAYNHKKRQMTEDEYSRLKAGGYDGLTGEMK